MLCSSSPSVANRSGASRTDQPGEPLDRTGQLLDLLGCVQERGQRADAARPGRRWPARVRTAGRRTAGRWCRTARSAGRPPGSRAPRCRRRSPTRPAYSCFRWATVWSAASWLLAIQPQHPLLVEREHLGLAAAAEQPVAAGAEAGEDLVLALAVVGDLRHRAVLLVGRPRGPRPVQLGHGQLAGDGHVELVGDRIDRALRGVDVYVGQARAGAAAVPARSAPTGSWRAARRCAGGSSSRSR